MSPGLAALPSAVPSSYLDASSAIPVPRGSPNGLVPKTQSVSHFRQTIACRKEGIWRPNRNTYNLSLFNSLRRVLTQPKVEGRAPVLPARLGVLVGANITPNGLRKMVISGPLLVLIHSVEFPPAEGVPPRAPARSLPQWRCPSPR